MNYRYLIIEAGTSRPSQRVEYNKYAHIGEDIICDKSLLDTYSYDGWNDIHHDLILITGAVEFADRSSYRNRQYWSREIALSVPVMRIEVWRNPEVKKLLLDVLNHLTGDLWEFDFRTYKEPPSIESRQRSLGFKEGRGIVVPFSEGIDSLCVANLMKKQGEVIRIRIGKHTQRNKFDGHFDRLPYIIKPKKVVDQSVRSRGFKFAAISAVVANITSSPKVAIPESGQGAIGPVMVGNYGTYPDYRNHPAFLIRMEKFIKRLFGAEIRYIQPQIWHTKGQTIRKYVDGQKENAQGVLDTRSCWQSRHNVRFDGKFRQCGICSACLLRRMSIQVAGLDEDPDSYVVQNLSRRTLADAVVKNEKLRLTRTFTKVGRLATRQMQRLADLSTVSDSDLFDHSFEIFDSTNSLNDSQTLNEVKENLREMLQNHAIEWNNFKNSFGRSGFLATMLE